MLLVMAVLGVKLMPERVVNGSAFGFLLLEAIQNTTCIQISSSFHSGVEMGECDAHQVCKFPNLMSIEGGVSARILCRDDGQRTGKTEREKVGGEGADALLVGQADLEVVEVGALELLLELVEGMLDLVLEAAAVIIIVVVLGPVAVGLMRMRHGGQGGGGADQLREGVGDLRAERRKA